VIPGTFVLGGATPPGKRRPVDEGVPLGFRVFAPPRSVPAAAALWGGVAGRHGGEVTPTVDAQFPP
jgi:hypothetical protein